MKSMAVAVQMFTLREESEKDFAGTLKKVAHEKPTEWMSRYKVI